MNPSSLVHELSTIIANSPDEQAVLKALAFRACIYRDQGQHGPAIADFTELIRRLPSGVDFYKERALLYIEEKRNGDAIEDFNRVIEIAPDGWTYANRGALFVRLRQLDDAIEDLQRALRLGNITTEVCFNWGLAHHHKKDYREAILGFNDAISLDPTYIKAIMHRGMAHSRLGEYLLAVKNYERALEIDPDYTNGMNNLAWLLATCPNPSFRDGERALKLAQTACEAAAWLNGNYLSTFAAANAELGYFDDAIRYQEKAITIPGYATNPDDMTRARFRLKLYNDCRPYRQDMDPIP